ncbi:adenylate kinase 7-like [Meleagris gallopavo]|uniref:adenylate kinase 7-like n=1 Tax=Meleagris gallopavo TaxID=9103 RepID=UPI000549A07C|nr:adenylate kinase 7-like [Meleagris gallopavo]
MAAGAARSRRIFLNHLDSYCGRSIGEYLSSCVVGASLESVEGEEEESENHLEAEVSRRRKEGLYQIVGTLSKPESIKPRFAEETYAEVLHVFIPLHPVISSLLVWI